MRKWANAEHTIGNIIENGHTVVIEVGQPGWADFVASSPDEYSAPSADAALEAWRISKVMSFPQMVNGTVSEGWITEQEGLAWLLGTLPADIEAFIASLPPSHQFLARARAINPSTVERLSPIVLAMAAIKGVSPTQMDTFFNTYSAL